MTFTTGTLSTAEATNASDIRTIVPLDIDNNPIIYGFMMATQLTLTVAFMAASEPQKSRRRGAPNAEPPRASSQAPQSAAALSSRED